ncbi:beta-lactamase/transpeptidase-like protein [Lentithecium fluviatile CBS 122367]|uniref:Beta-lactamase/transpeptidase-like protein n=1 Tax=Lentithecium fluviatile CBS 122367 TaxID=1168545 RepID=A0A6G1JDI7_9PLEO|nr:beta-lactamase/transpeptidase-like protein [Lentithecium fluviatile CBS 122367]
MRVAHGTFLAAFSLLALVQAKCYEPTVAHPLPEYDAAHPILRNAFAHIKALLTIAVQAPEYATNSFSVQVTSSKESLWAHHHTARERNASRPDIPEVNGDALYRIASITKAFTVLGILQLHAAGNLSLEDPIDKFFEGLRGERSGSIPWGDITLRSLASQLSGIPREFAQSDMINAPSGLTPEDYGLPPVSRKGLLECDEYSPDYEKACTADDLIRTITAREPLFAPNQQSTYSNVAFELLGLVISNVTNQTYDAYINEAIFKPLHMSKSTLKTPPDSAGVIPSGPEYWDVDEGVQAPTGGIFSSSSDLSKFLRYVLTHYNGITTSANWILPASPGRGVRSYYGMPWEIFHTDRVLLNSQRAVRFVTKGGGLPGYSSIIIILPEYDLGITILVGGPPALFERLQEIVTTELVRAAEQLAILQLQQRYLGTFISPDPSLNSSLVLTADHRGLVLEKFISNSSDVMGTLFPQFFGPDRAKNMYFPLVPTLLYRDEKKQKGERWRFVYADKRTDAEPEVWDDFCPDNIDLLQYAGKPFNELVLWEGPNGIINDIQLTGFRANLTRIIVGADSEGRENLEL